MVLSTDAFFDGCQNPLKSCVVVMMSALDPPDATLARRIHAIYQGISSSMAPFGLILYILNLMGLA
jgi:hypothetical protein